MFGPLGGPQYERLPRASRGPPHALRKGRALGAVHAFRAGDAVVGATEPGPSGPVTRSGRAPVPRETCWPAGRAGPRRSPPAGSNCTETVAGRPVTLQRGRTRSGRPTAVASLSGWALGPGSPAPASTSRGRGPTAPASSRPRPSAAPVGKVPRRAPLTRSAFL